MKISTQTDYLFQHMDEGDAIRICAEAGYDCLDFTFPVSHTVFERESDKLYRNAEKLRVCAESHGLYFNQAHAPFSTRPEDKLNYEAIVKSMEISSALGVGQIIVHPLQYLPYSEHAEELKKANYEFYCSLIPYCEKYQIKVAIENMWQFDSLQHRIVHSTCASPEEFCDYIDMMDSPWFIACLDIGHCPLVGEDIPNMIRMLGHDRLKALHVHDVDFVHDDHTLPGIKKINYEPVTKALGEIDYRGEFTLEAESFLEGFELEFIPDAVGFMAKRARFLSNKIDDCRKTVSASAKELSSPRVSFLKV